MNSGYEAALELNKAEATQIYSEPSTTALKSIVWRLKTSRKLKHYLWQTLEGCIATCSRLVDRHCGTDCTCQRCGDTEETINHLLFECPPALQTWALSSIPTIPGLFPCSSIYSNIDHLFYRTKETGAAEHKIEPFPWIFWYIWKARNEKAFNGNEVSPLDTLQLAIAEAENWKMAQQVQVMEDSEDESHSLHDNTDQIQWPRCQTDASWKEDEPLFGCGFVILHEDGSSRQGAKANVQVQSPLHTEI